MTLLELEKFNMALEVSKDALRYRESDVNFYYYGIVNEMVGLWDEARDAYEQAIRKNRNFYEAYTRLADLQRRKYDLQQALASINKVIRMNKNYLKAYEVRSAIYADQLNYSAAINDISTILLVEPENADMYFKRGKYYQGYAQHFNAISDFTKVISLEPENIEAYFNRAYSSEQIMRLDDAIKDYKKLAEIAEDDDKAIEMLTQAEERLFELNRETDKPTVELLTPKEQEGNVLNIPRDETVVPIVGKAMDESMIDKIIVNEMSLPFTQKDEYFEFLTSVNVEGLNQLKVEVIDVYNNSQTTFYDIVRTEVNPPIVRILAPYASDNNVIWLESNNPTIYVEGSIEDESLITSIYIDEVIASYVPDDKNPGFQAMINIQNKNQFVVKATDAYGNISETTFSLNREAANMLEDNPMGKTWVVFIENSNYNSFASLEGPVRDITLMKTALARYTVHNFIHKKDMNKQEMEKFFAIELRDLLRSNRVNSLLVWYAGHGKFVNETGYWVPIDAKRDDEFTYFNINALKASMQSYPTTVNHTLVITDACESGPSFYQAMRSDLVERSCNDPSAIGLKSSQVFSSAGYELAVDNSQFTRTFANVLANNQDACIPIESIVLKVTDAVVNSNQQKPQFGKIAGLEDENGTFFFISK
jgi:tetratricopeptide (TPR) repeat protein